MTKTEYNKRYYEKNREYLCAQSRAWRRRNIETVILKDRARYARDRLKKLASKKATYPLHREARHAYNRRYYLRNIERFKKAGKAWRHKNREYIRLLNNRYRLLHPDKVRKWEENANRSHDKLIAADARRRALELKAITAPETDLFYEFVRRQGMVNCSYCGLIMAGKDAHIDHVVPLTRGGTHLPENLCISCKPCNSSKGNKLLSEWKGRLQPEHFLWDT